MGEGGWGGRKRHLNIPNKTNFPLDPARDKKLFRNFETFFLEDRKTNLFLYQPNTKE